MPTGAVPPADGPMLDESMLDESMLDEAMPAELTLAGLTLDELTLDDVTAAIDELRTNLPGVTDPAERADILRGLGELSWRRYLLLVGQGDASESDVDAALTDAVDGLRLARDSLGPEVDDRPFAWWLGLAMVDRYEVTGDLADLDRAIASVEEALDLASDTMEGPGGAGAEAMARSVLGRLLMERHDRTPAEADLDRAIAELTAAMRLEPWPHSAGVDSAGVDSAGVDSVGNDGTGDSEPFWWWDALSVCGRARAERWESRRQREDLEAAIECFQRVVEHPDATEVALGLIAGLAQLLHDRAALTEKDAGREEAMLGLADALRWSREAVARAAPDDPARLRVVGVAVTTGIAHAVRTMDPGELADLERLTAELVAACQAAGVPDDGAVAARGMVLGLRASGGLATTPELTAQLNDAMEMIARMLAESPEMEYVIEDPTLPPRLAALLPTDVLLRQQEAARRAYESMPTGPDRAAAAGMLAQTEFMVCRRGLCDFDVPRLVETLTEAMTAHPDNPTWQVHMRTLLGMTLITGAQAGEDYQIDDALAVLAEARELVGDDAQRRDLIEALVADALQVRADMRGDLDDAAQAIVRGERTLASAGLNEQLRLSVRMQTATKRAQLAFHQKDWEQLRRAVDEFRACLAEMPAGDRRRGPAAASLASAELRLVGQAGVPGATVPGATVPDATGLAEVAARARQAAGAAGVGPTERASMLGQAGLAEVVAALAAEDVGALAPAFETLRRALDAMQAGHADALMLRQVVGATHGGRAEGLRSVADARLAVTELEAVRSSVGDDVGHSLYTACCLALGRAYRSRGDLAGGEARRDDRRRSRDMGLRALRGHAWRVLVQRGTANAAAAAWDVAEQAMEVAGWCVTDADAAQAAVALDACCGLVLHAATTSGGLGDDLAAAGHADLAAEWRQATSRVADPDVPSDLRHRVLRALAGGSVHHGESARLLDPPTLDQVTSALQTSSVQALVYLVPQSHNCPAVAVVVPASGEPAIVHLPVVGAAPPVVLDGPRPGHDRDAGAVGQPAGAKRFNTSRTALGDLAGWAWSAVMRRLLDHCARREFQRPYRLVLVPMGELGLVPWHAAVSPEGRHVVQDAVISYAASARLFCDVMSRERIGVEAGGLIVGDPTGDLPYARAEAAAIHERIYPGAAFLGRRDATPSDATPSDATACDGTKGGGAAHDGTKGGGAACDGPSGSGTPEELLAWLAGAIDGQRGVLHLACHGVVEPRRANSSYLMLSNGTRCSGTRCSGTGCSGTSSGENGSSENGSSDGLGVLSAERLVEQLPSTGAGYRLGTVTLAACSTGVSGHGYDEAFSLATAFLAAGARSVVGSLWRVPDDATSLLMYMVHHYLAVDGVGPAQALRLAQLWMLDTDRRTPPTMPAELRARVPMVDRSDLAAWAGFGHFGQW